MKYLKSKIGWIFVSVYLIFFSIVAYQSIVDCRSSCGEALLLVTLPSIIITSPFFELFRLENFDLYPVTIIGLSMILNSVLIYVFGYLISPTVKSLRSKGKDSIV